VTLVFGKDGAVQMRAARAADEDRPWSPAPKRSWGRSAPLAPAEVSGSQAAGDGAEPGEDADDSPLE
jgi:competence protein ComEC